MWRSKKFIVAVLAATVLLVGGIGGVALAQTGSTGDSSGKTLLARVAEILGIDQQKVEDAFAQAQTEMQNEALDNYLKNLVDQGKITQEQADQYKAWVQARPDMSQYQQQLKDWQQARPGLPSDLKDWQGAKPDVPLPGGFGGRAFRGGMMRGGLPFFGGK
jgi:hypothetical protein